jgi:Kef-type K+ transport system membrane component KefB/Trk K+ transport system NAD-binding subunit
MALEVFVQLSLVLVVAVAISSIMRLLKQPLIIGYIFTGLLVSPAMLNIIPEENALQAFIHIGISLLLFMVGLNLNPRIIKDVGKISLITGLGQVIFTSGIGFLIGRALGFTNLQAVYVAVALTFSSTIIIMKLLSDKGDLETLYGRISIGFLIVQDLIVVIALLVISSISTAVNPLQFLTRTVLVGVAVLVILFAFSYHLLPKLLKKIAKSQELLLLFSIAWCFALAALFSGLNFSLEIGALLAGITLAMSPYRYEIAAKMKPLRDFFIILFFISLGSQMVFNDITTYILPIILFSFFILFGNPIIVMVLMGFLGYTKRNGFLTGLTVAQISEFSLILISLGVTVGHLDKGILSMVTLVGLITISGSSYMIIYGNKIYEFLSPYLKIFERKGQKVDQHKYHHDKAYEVILFGYNRIGYTLLQSLKKINNKLLVVDYNPDTVTMLAQKKFHVRYGDASDSELLNELQLDKVKMIVSTIDEVDVNLLLLNKALGLNKKLIFIATSAQIDDAMQLYEQGASYVIIPHFLGAHHASNLIEDYAFDVLKFRKERSTHVRYLKKRKKHHHDHLNH